MLWLFDHAIPVRTTQASPLIQIFATTPAHSAECIVIQNASPIIFISCPPSEHLHPFFPRTSRLISRQKPRTKPFLSDTLSTGGTSRIMLCLLLSNLIDSEIQFLYLCWRGAELSRLQLPLRSLCSQSMTFNSSWNSCRIDGPMSFAIASRLHEISKSATCTLNSGSAASAICVHAFVRTAVRGKATQCSGAGSGARAGNDARGHLQRILSPRARG
jgi:hypothetical protein